jgi:hypothetical protein
MNPTTLSLLNEDFTQHGIRADRTVSRGLVYSSME